jgi:hypothetical protein
MANDWNPKPINDSWNPTILHTPVQAEDPRSVTRLRLGASADSYQAGLYGVAEAAAHAAGAQGVEDWARSGREDNEREADVQLANASKKGAIDSYKNVDGFGTGLNYAGGLLAQSLPYAAEAMAGGVVARGLSTGLRAAVNAGRAVGAADDVVQAGRAAESALNTRSMVGSVAASYPSSVGDILGNQREQTGGQTDLLSASLLGIPYAGLNMLGEGRALAQGKLTRNAFGAFDKVDGWRGAAARTASSVGVTGLEEGAGEGLQEAINQAGRVAVDPNASMTSDDALNRYKESAIGGAALGGMFGGLGGWRRSEAWEAAQKKAKAPTDLLNSPDNWTTSQGFDPQTKPAPKENPLGDLTPDWTTEPGAAHPGNPGGIDGAGLWPAVGDPAVTTGRDRSGLQIPSVPGRPGLADTMLVGRPGEVAATDPQNAAMLDPGAAEARRQYLARQEELQRKADEVAALEQQYAQSRKLAHDELVDKDPTGQPYIKLKDREIQTHKYLTSLRASGKITDAEHSQYIARLREALKAEDKGTLGKISKEVEARNKLAQEKAPNVGAQDVSGQQPVAGSVAGSPDAQGSVATAGRDAAAANGASGLSAGAAAPAGEVAVLGAGEKPARPAAVRAGVAKAKPFSVTVVGHTKDGEPKLNLVLGDKTMTLQRRFFDRLMAVAGFNLDGSHLGRTRSADEAAEFLTAHGGDGHKQEVTRDDINNTLKKMGLTPAKIEQAMKTNEGEGWLAERTIAPDVAGRSIKTSDETAFASAAGAHEEGGPTGLRVASGVADINGDHLLQPGETSAQKRLGKEGSALLAKNKFAGTETGEERRERVTAKRQGRLQERAARDAEEAAVAEQNRREMAYRVNRMLHDPAGDELRNNANADWDSEIGDFNDLTDEAKAGYYIEYGTLDDQLRERKIDEETFFEELERAQLEAWNESESSRRSAAKSAAAAGAGARPEIRGAAASASGDRKGGAAKQAPAVGTTAKAANGTDGVQFSKSGEEQRGPVSVSVHVDGHTLTFPDAKAAMARLQEKIDRHKALLKCLLQG